MTAWIVFCAASLLLFYSILGYPILLALRRPKNAPPIGKDPEFRTTVSVIIAVYNGAAFVRAKLKTLAEQEYPRELMEILIVSDGSTDQTEEIVREYPDPRVRLLTVPRGGKAAALNAALGQATGEILFFTDIRQLLEPDAVRQLVANFADPSVGAVTGELKLMPGDDGEQADMDLYWRYELWARRQHSAIDSLFNTTGCIYAIRRKCVTPIPPDTIADDAVMPLRAFFQGYRVIFDPAAVAYDYPAVAGTEFRRRFRNLAGLWQVHARFPELFTGRNRMRLHFLSHKFARLAMPWTIVGAYAATFAMPDSLPRTILLIGELLVLVLAACDPLFSRGFPLKRISSPARTFLLMNLAALAALAVFFVPPTRLWVPTKVNTR